MRPAHTIPEVVIGSDDLATVVGVLTVEAERHERHAAANNALRYALDRRLFVLEELREFAFLRHADSAEDLRDHIAQKWRQTRLDGATCLRTAAALSRSARRATLATRACRDETADTSASAVHDVVCDPVVDEQPSYRQPLRENREHDDRVGARQDQATSWKRGQ